MGMNVVLAVSILAVASVGRATDVGSGRDVGARAAAESQAARTTGEHRGRLEPILLALDRRLDAATAGRRDLNRDRLAREAAAFLADWQTLDHSPDLPEVLASAELEAEIRYRIDRRLADAGVITRNEIGLESAERPSILPTLLARLRQPPAPLAGSGVLSGKVTRSDTSAGVQNVTVQLYIDNGAYPGNSVGTAVTNASGDYQFNGLDAGTYYLLTFNTLGLIDQVYAGIACPFAFCKAPLAGTPVAVTSPGTTTGIDFALAPGGLVSGKVTDASTSAPIVGAQVRLFTAEGLGAGSGTTDAAGNYTTNLGLPSGTYTARLSPGAPYVGTLYDSIVCVVSCDVSRGTPITVTSPNPTTNINFTVGRGAAITGVVRDAATSGGLAGVTVQLRDAQGNQLVGSGAADQTTDGSGLYVFLGFPAGTYYVVTTNARYVGTGYLDQVYSGKACTFGFCDVTTGTPVNVALGATVAGIDFSLGKAPGGISGTVTSSATSAPISGASVRLVTEQNRNSNVLTRTTDGAGNYFLTGLPSGRYFVQADAGAGFVPEAYDNANCLGGCRPAVVGTPVVVGGSVVTGVDFALDPAPATGSISGKVVAADTGLSLPNVQVLVTDPSSQDVASAQTNATGDYTVTNLPPGTYNARTISAGSVQARVYVDEVYSGVPCFAGGCNPAVAGTPITVAAGNTTANINFTLPHGGHLTGKVTSASTSAPLANVQVALFDGGGFYGAATTSDALGNYGFVGLASGSYYARTFDVSHVDEVYNNTPCVGCDVRTSGTPIPVTAPSTTPNVNLALDAGARISGSVTDVATGAALPRTALALFDAHGSQLRSVTGDDLGRYRFGVGLPSGAYFARATGAGPYMTEAWSNVHCSSCPPNAGTAIRVTGGADVTGVNFAMDKGGRVAGKVTNASGEPVGADVVIFDSSDALLTGGGTDVDGNYVTPGLLPSGTYYAATLNVAGYADEIYDNISAYSLAKASLGTGIGVTAGATTPSIDFTLGRGGRFSGKVTSAATGLPLANVPVVPLDGAGHILDDGTSTNLAGLYTTRKAFPAGNYYALAYSTQGLVSVLYNGVPFSGWPPVGGTAIPVAANATTPNVDFALGVGGFVSGTVTRTGGAPAFNTVVQLYSSVLDPQGKARFVTSADVDASGHYRTQSALRTGTYFALVTGGGYLGELYNNIPCTVNDVAFPPRPDCDITKGTIVSVTAPNPTTGIDFTLDLKPPTRLFNTVTPCRLVDTRTTNAPALAGGASRTFVLAGKCGIPASAKAVSVNVTITQPTAPGDLRLYPGGTTLPLVSAINYSPGQTRANSAVVTLGAAGDLAVRCDQAAGSTTHFVLDVNGYLE